MIQIGLRLHDAPKLPLDEVLPIVRAAGFTCGHIALSKSISEYSVANSALTPGYAAYLKKLFAKNEIDIAILGCYLNISSDTVDIERYLAHIRLASLMEVGLVGTETNGSDDYEIFIKNLRRVVAYAERMGVIFGIEPVAKHLVSTPEIARRVLDEINSPNLGIIFDPVNLLSIDNYENRQDVHRRALELLGKDILAVHIKDFVVKDGDLESVAVGNGNMDYTEIFSFLKKEKPFIHATLENTTPENAAESRVFVEKLLAEVN